jgi:hypothetical protein
MLHKFRIALAVTLLALAAVAAVDSASAWGYYSVPPITITEPSRSAGTALDNDVIFNV